MSHPRRRSRAFPDASRPRSAISGSSALRTAARAAGDGCRPAVGDRLELAVAVELVTEQIPQRIARGCSCSARSEPQLVDLEQPQLAGDRAAPALAASSVVAIPPAMFAPGALCTSATPACSKIPAAIAAVVVLPLVAETSALPCASRRAEVADRIWLEPQQHLARNARGAATAQARERRHGPREG